MNPFSRRVFCAVASGLLALSGGCLSPTLPLPPPDEPQIESAGQGLVTLSGRIPEPNAGVIAANLDTGAYSGQDADEAGQYRFQIPAESGDWMRIWYLVGNDRSQTRDFEIPLLELEAMAEPAVTPPDADGLVTVSGFVPEPLALVFASNAASGATEDAQSDEEGYFSIQIAAGSGDELEVWYKFGGDFSPVVAVDVP